MANSTVIYGGPGSGKTTKLLQLLQEELTHTPVSQIAYVSYTRKGTYAGVDRAKEAYSLTNEDCKYFKTLHALANLITGKQAKLLTPKTAPQLYEQYARMGIAVSTQKQYERAFSYETNVGITLTNDELLSRRIEPNSYKSWKDSQRWFLQQFGFLTFDGLLQYCVDNEITVPVKTVFIDEAQDITPLQWKAISVMFKNAEQFYIAGDPNQAIFEWAGAEVNKMFDVARTENIVLDTSHRCSRAVWHAVKICWMGYDVDLRSPLPEKCADREGFALIDYAPLKQDFAQSLTRLKPNCTGMYLARSDAEAVYNYLPVVSAAGVPFVFNNAVFVGATTWRKLTSVFKKLFLPKNREDFMRHIALCKGHKGVECESAYTQKTIFELFNKHKLPLPEYAVQNTEWLKCIVELLYAGAMARNVPHKQFYARHATLAAINALCNGNFNNLPERVYVGNVHRIKGGEADFVVYNCALHKTNDAESPSNRRVDFVAYSRARDVLYVFSTTQRRYGGSGYIYGTPPEILPATKYIDLSHIQSIMTNHLLTLTGVTE